MKVQLVVRGESEADDNSRSLYRWLREDAAVIRNARVSLVSDVSAPPGSMSDVEVIQAVVDDATAIGDLLLAFLSWRDARDRRASTMVQVRRADGTAVTTVKGAAPAEVRKIIEALDG